MSQHPPPTLLSTAQAAARLGLSMTTIRQMIREGVLDARKAKRRLLVTAESLDRYVASLPRAKGG